MSVKKLSVKKLTEQLSSDNGENTIKATKKYSRNRIRKMTTSVMGEPERVSPEEAPDPYKELRYRDDVGVGLERRGILAPLLPVQEVHVKRLRKNPPKKVEIITPITTSREYQLSWDKEEPLEAYCDDTSMVARRCEALRREKIVAAMRQKTLETQEMTLKNWDKDVQYITDLEQRLGRSLGVDPHCDTRLIVRPLALPPLENHRGPSYGPESDFPYLLQKERFYRGLGYFLQGQHFGPEDDSLLTSLTWSQRKFYKPPLSIVKPNIDGVLGHPCTVFQKSEQQRALEKLYVKGRGLALEGQMPECLEVVVTNTNPSMSTSPRQTLDGGPASFGLSCSIGSSVDSLGRRCQQETFSCGPRLESPYFVRNVVPAFKLDRFTFVWGERGFHGIVELGVVTKAGEKGWTKVLLGNPGCCAIRYSWRPRNHVDHFGTGRYRTSPFIFDISDGIILPEQTISLKVQFFAKYAGSWTERWYVKTTPCVGPRCNGEIPVSLWGQALQADLDVIREDRIRLEKQLDMSCAQRMCERDVWDLIKFLPIRQPRRPPLSLVEPSFQAVHVRIDQVANFLRMNPGLYYHSVAKASLDLAWDECRSAQTTVVVVKCHSFVHGKTPSNTSYRKSEGSSAGKRQARNNPQAAQSLKRGGQVSTVSRMSRKAKQQQDRARAAATLPSGSLEQAVTSAVVGGCASRKVRDVSAKRVYRKGLLIHESLPVKESVLRNVNLSIVALQQKPFAPPMLQYKYIMVRQRLVHMLDSIQSAEWRIRENLDLLENAQFTRLANFAKEPANAKGRHRSISRKKVSSVKGTIIDWKDDKPRHWRRSLREVVLAQVTQSLLDLLPIVTHDGYVLNPCLPKPEIYATN